MAQINNETRFVDVYKKFVYNNNLRKLLILHKPPLTLIKELKGAVHHYQMSLLKYTRSTPHIAPSTTAGLGTMQHEITDQKQERIHQIQELQQQLAPSRDCKANRPVPMEIDAITRYERNRDDEGCKSHLTKNPAELFFMDPDHKEVRINEGPDVQDYWEAGLMTESLNALKTGRVDHLQIVCYHCGYRGHMKANCPDRRKLNTQPWDRRWKSEARKMFVRKGHNTGGGSGQ